MTHHDLMTFLGGSLSGGIVFTIAALIYQSREFRKLRKYALRIRRQNRTINLD